MRTIDLNSAHIFVQVVVSGSFTGAATALGIPKSTISGKVTELEKTLGVTLMVRTTRKLKLTDVGTEYFKKAEGAVRELQSASEEASQSQRRPTGTLKITAPADLANFVIMEAISEYRRKFPEVKIELDFSDRHVDLVAEGFDIAIRAGVLSDSSLVAKKIGKGCLILVASLAYLRKAPPLKHPRDLTLHSCMKLSGSPLEKEWLLRAPQGRTARVSLVDGISANSFTAIKSLVVLGEGVALVPSSLCREELAGKKFIQVLPDWTTEEVPVHIVYPPQRFSTAKVREIIPLLEKRVRELYNPST